MPDQPSISVVMDFAPDDDRVDHARLLLEALQRQQSDVLERLVCTCALAHLESHDPPRRPLPVPEREALVYRDEVMSALVDVVREHDNPSERTRAALALQELATPLHPFGAVR
jgi:hypothetical protein